MRNNTTILATLAALVLLSSVSCVKDQDPVFEKTASERLTEALTQAQKVLQTPQNGWSMRYFPHPDQAYGGYTFFVKFTEDEVTAWSELGDPDESYTSLYKMTRDDGPVLSFDMDNYFLHYFATPSGSSMSNRYGENGLYQGYQGDFEFIILSAEPTGVVLKGKRSGSLAYLEPAQSNPTEYLAQLKQAKENNFKVLDLIYISTFETEIGGVPYRMQLNRDNQQAVFFEKGKVDDKQSVAYMNTLTGIRLYEPFEVNGVTLEEMNWNAVSTVLESGDLTWNYLMPEGWMSYDEYLGDYDLVYNDNEDWWSDPVVVPVTLVKDVDQKSYLMKGVSDMFDVRVDYDLSGGNLAIMGQIVGKFGENDVYFAACSASKSSSGGVTWTGWRSTKYGIRTQADPESIEKDPAHFVTRFVPGPSAAGKPVNSFALIMQKPDGTSGGWMNGEAYADWFLFGDKYYAVFWLSLTKK